MTKKLVVILALLIIAQAHLSLVSASESSQSSTPSSTIKSKLELLKQEIASKAAEIKQAVSQKISNKAWSGIVKNKNDKSITISGISGARKILVNEYTLYLAKPKSNTSLKDVAIGDFIYALGDMDDAGNLAAKKVIKTKAPTVTQPTQVWGSIKSINGNIFKIASKSGTLNVTTGGKTDFQLGSQDASIADAKVEHKAIVVGTVSGDQQYAYFVYFIPQTANDQPEKVSSSSARATATPSASPKVTPKPSAKN